MAEIEIPPFERYRGVDSYFGGSSPLSEGVGYLVVLGFGMFFSVFTTFLVFLNKHYGAKGDETSEHFK
ncbi:hypothetical protein FisN_2Hu196 [Fistulifera solaris]|jgi:hypothetical protein|uniref:Uncharacterized protein n=1 Tax=Fistulifera solaris TaxID=1519565 RepID=A0A1Z5KJB8_FISSO|nr:hypothetical protein FisN_2Hu196 [Fistulifera solaris]|eukprot:GAX26384.1 hypothetical protein FisN_2Hu196 [Fistulifera solaris]